MLDLAHPHDLALAYFRALGSNRSTLSYVCPVRQSIEKQCRTNHEICIRYVPTIRLGGFVAEDKHVKPQLKQAMRVLASGPE